MTIKALCLLLLALLTTACASSDSKSTEQPPVVTTACEDPRPQICTMEYMPVCATLEDGQSKTYSSGCSACGDTAVKQHQPGACEE